MLCACNSACLPQLQQAAGTCLSALQLFSAVVDSYVSDYFVSDLKSLVRPCLFHYLNDCCVCCLANVIVPLDSQRVAVKLCVGPSPRCAYQSSPAPLLLQCLRRLSRRYQLNCRAVDADAAPLAADLGQPCRAGTQLSRAAGEADDAGGQRRRSLGKKVKQKKEHEICALSGVIHWVWSSGRAGDQPLVVDAGSGMGHLARHLALARRLPVLAIEASDRHGPAAADLDRHAERLSSSSSESAQPPHVRHVFQRLETGPQLLALCPPARPLLLTGLHACGDLTTTLVSLLCRRSACDASSADARCRGLVSVGCCYMRGRRDFPLSRRLARAGAALSYEALELACHSLLAFAERLRRAQPERLRSHAYRAGLQLLLRPGIGLAGEAGNGSSAQAEDKGLAGEAGNGSSAQAEANGLAGEAGNGSSAQAEANGLAGEAGNGSSAQAEATGLAGEAGNGSSAQAEANGLAAEADAVRVTKTEGSGLATETKRRRYPVKKRCQLAFREYAAAVLGCDRSAGASPSPQAMRHAEQLVESRWREVLTWNCLRLLLAPLAESAVLLDRLLHLREACPDLTQLALLPLFHPSQSPRNVCIVAVRGAAGEAVND